MSGNYWSGTQFRHWILSREDLDKRRHGPTKLETTARELLALHLIQVGVRLNFPGVVWSTAVIYYNRFYTTNSFCDRDIDPFILAPTCLYLSSKVEEMGQINPEPIFDKFFRHVQETPDLITIRGSHVKSPSLTEIFACESLLLGRLSFELVIFHPHRDVKRYVIDSKSSLEVEETTISILNDIQVSDVLFLYPPYIAALASLFVSAVSHHAGEEIESWFDGLNVDLSCVRRCADDIVSFYERISDEKLHVETIEWFKINWKKNHT
jgi:cyclin C